jgi:hypothetical protein
MNQEGRGSNLVDVTFFPSLDFSEISEGSRVKCYRKFPKIEGLNRLRKKNYWPGDLLPYTLRGISRKYALLLGQCTGHTVSAVQ